ncbi:hypothetical protein F5Y08DRAFT_350464 [Xylaria arbuscula]|nr:hypothetical protein F5Y08DRAFT_350464 [Xylaria arbuscula]
MAIINMKFLSRLWKKYIGTSIGWHQAAKVNCILLATLSIVLSSVLVYIAAKSDNILQVVYIFDGSCHSADIPLINTFLHLLINVISTLVVGCPQLVNLPDDYLASSNFFMQVLNAPSREELDAAHTRSTWMDVGVNSIRNIFKVSAFKRLCWFGLMITSIPIHLVFNSTVFNTQYRRPDYTLTIATEEFVNGGSFFLPGASLFTYNNGFLDASLSNSSSQYYSGDFLLNHSRLFDVTYGDIFELKNYTANNSALAGYISMVAQYGNTWNKLSFSKCQEEFGLYGGECHGLTQHSDVILVTDSTEGWVRSDMWDLTEDQAHFWDTYVPGNDPNHLFFHAPCVMSPYRTVEISSCSDTCYNALGGRYIYNDYGGYYRLATQRWPSRYPFFFDTALSFVNRTNAGLSFFNVTSPIYKSHLVSGLQAKSDILSVQYCLARPIQDACHIGASPILLLCVLLCLISKTSIAILVTRIADNRKEKPLITLGDCVASFIETEDSRSTDYTTASTTDLRRLFPLFGPQPWRGIRPRRAMSVPSAVLVTTSLLFAIAISLCIYLLSGLHFNENFKGSFLASSDNPVLHKGVGIFLSNVLVANSPQVLLSLCYLAFNNLFTYFCVAIEWESFSKNTLPLRVTDPKGKQISTYRLQLPYRYSLPLMALSASLHWLVANTIYVILTEGGYIEGMPDDNLPAGVTAVLGYPPKSLFVLTIVAFITATIPFIWSFKRSSSNIIVVGTNSLLISLACRVSPLVPQHHNFNGNTNFRSSELEVLEQSLSTSNRQASEESSNLLGTAASTQAPIGSNENDLEDNKGSDPRQRIARSKLRWGVLPVRPERSEHRDYELLGFGVETDQITAPVKGRLYQ